MTTTDSRLPRPERRRRSEAQILDAARELFATDGYERATIRAVAAKAGVDPALVMQHFGSKDALFAASTRWSSAHQTILSASTEELASAAIDDLLSHFEDADDREAAVALMRSCLTHPAALEIMRDRVMHERKCAVAARIEGPDAELRAGLFAALMIGLGMARYLIRLEPVASAAPEDLRRLMEPALAALVGTAQRPPAEA